MARTLEVNPDNAIAQLVRCLDLETLDRDHFVGDPGEGTGRLFGGQVAAQSVVAAGRTVEEARLHSLHAYFLRPGRYGSPIRFVVDRIRDGRTFTTRRVVAHQAGEAIFNLSASFAKPEEGIAHQEAMPDAPDPLSLATFSEVHSHFWGEPLPDDPVHRTLDMRMTDLEDYDMDGDLDPVRRTWIRLNGPPPEDPLMRIAILVYASDRTLMGSALRASGLRPGPDYTVTSLDHAMWLHHIPKLDDWLLYTAKSPMARDARALVHGAMHDRSGIRIASVTQEGLVRRVRGR